MFKLEEKTIPVIKFFVGEKQFDTEIEARSYIKEKVKSELLDRKYFIVNILPYTTDQSQIESQKTFIISVPLKNSSNILYQYLMNNYGTPLMEIESGISVSRYEISGSKMFNSIEDLKSYLNDEYVSLGASNRYSKLEAIHINKNAEEIQLELN